jgi:hypothetical protein
MRPNRRFNISVVLLLSILIMIPPQLAFAGRKSSGGSHSSHHSFSSGSHSYHYHSGSSRHRSGSYAPGVQRDSKGHIERSEEAKQTFMKQSGYPNGRPGYVIDHITPLKRGGPDTPRNMQWQTKDQAKAKDTWE